MNTVELIGPSGAGKTTFARSLSDAPNVYAGRSENDRARCFLKGLSPDFFVKTSPSFVQREVVRRIFPYSRSRYEGKFLCEHPGVLETIAAIVRRYDDREHVVRYMLDEAAWFEVHRTRLADDETYVIDDGLYQFHLRLPPLDGWSASEIMDRLYVPDRLVFVDAPADVCLGRQESRPRNRASRLKNLGRTEAIAVLEEMRTAADAFVTEAEGRGVDVDVVDTS